MHTSVFVFIGSFDSDGLARAYSEPQWEPEPLETVSDSEYQMWEERNPVWLLREDLGIYLDNDFIETITDQNWQSYLSSLLDDSKHLHQILSHCPEKTNCLVLVFKQALSGFDAELKSTPTLSLMGEYPCTI